MEKIKEILGSRRLWTIVGCVLAMALVAFVYFYPDAPEGHVLQQYDMRQGAANGQEAKAFEEATGETTRWTNSLFGGMPTFQIAPSYPSNQWFDWVNSVYGLGLPNPANLMLMMMLGMFILLMTMEMRWYVALIGAIGYGLSSYFVILIGAGHIWKFTTLAYVPPTIAGIVLCYRGRYLWGAALASLFAMMQIASNHVQMTYYFLFVIAGFSLAYLIKLWREKKLRQWAVATAVLAGAGLLAVTANLPSLYNTYEYSKETIRGGHSELQKASTGDATEGLDRSYITAYSYGGAETFTLMIPNVKGGASIKPEKGQNKIKAVGDLDEVKQMGLNEAQQWYLSQFTQYFGEPEMTNGPVYVGALICALFLLGCFVCRGPLKWVLIGLTLLSILLALGRNCAWLTNWMIDYFPMYNKFRTPESILVIAEFTMPLLAAMALQEVLTKPAAEAWERYRRPFLVSFGLVLVICLLGILCPQIFGSAITDADRQMDAQITGYLLQQGYPREMATALSLNDPTIYSAIENARLGMVESDSLRSFMIVAVGGLVLWFWFVGKLSLTLVVIVVGCLVLGDLFLVNKRYLDSDSFTATRQLSTEEMFPLTVADQSILADTAMNYRVIDYTGFGSPTASYRHKSIGGYHAAKLTRYQDLMDYYISDQSHDSHNMMAMLNLRYAIVDPNKPAVRIPDGMGNAWLVDAIDYVATPDEEIAAVETLQLDSVAVADKRFEPVLGKSAPKQPGDTIFETTYAPNRLTYSVNTNSGGVAVFSEIFFPWGWHATIDGTPAEIGRVNYMLRAIKVPAGHHTIVMTFQPESLKNTTTAAYVAIALIYLLLIAAVVFSFPRKAEKRGEIKVKS